MLSLVFPKEAGTFTMTVFPEDHHNIQICLCSSASHHHHRNFNLFQNSPTLCLCAECTPNSKFPPKFINRNRMCRVLQPKNTTGPANVCRLAMSKRTCKKIHVFELPKRSRTRREEWRCGPTLASLSYSTSSANQITT